MRIDRDDDAFDRVRAALIDAARDRRLLSYSDVAAIMDITTFGQGMGRKVGALGDAINEFEHEAGRPMLSALIVRRADRVPGRGFYHCAYQLGRITSIGDDQSLLAFWKSERDAVYAYWVRRASG